MEKIFQSRIVMSFNNRKFNPNIWETPQPPPFVNNQNVWNAADVGGHFIQNQGHGQFPNNNFNQNFQQNFNNQNLRPLLSLPLAQDPPQQSFRKFNNQNQDNYRRPGPAFTRNSNYGYFIYLADSIETFCVVTFIIAAIIP